METLITEFVTNPDNVWYLSFLQPIVAHHRKKSLWRCRTKSNPVTNELGWVFPDWFRRRNNLGAGCHWGHRTGPWRRGGPNVL